ncbi:hypothetical protein [Solitalea koreensis]|uniref:Uncharacterized protein n=1 Tax=Solitalea koreensis TaxID=543615 RepID=A0A521BLR1_9SPHI|nr:hypothetical protein [Solitalea koreensis]SMO48087.1 hypothetical protein SAMN06265350_102324 [Solitalea koreensis]
MKKVVILIIGSGMAGLLDACSVRKKTTEHVVHVVKAVDSASIIQEHTQLVINQYGDFLKGSTVLSDTSGTDSSVFESNGIKLKLKIKGAKPGAKVEFLAEAKPVARSTLTHDNTQQTRVSTTQSAVIADKTNKSVNRPSVWMSICAGLSLGITLIIALRWGYLKFLK